MKVGVQVSPKRTEADCIFWGGEDTRISRVKDRIFLEVSIFDLTPIYKLEKHIFQKFKLQAEDAWFPKHIYFFVESFSGSMLNFDQV